MATAEEGEALQVVIEQMRRLKWIVPDRFWGARARGSVDAGAVRGTFGKLAILAPEKNLRGCNGFA